MIVGVIQVRTTCVSYGTDTVKKISVFEMWLGSAGDS
jgi:hypothetical protein